MSTRLEPGPPIIPRPASMTLARVKLDGKWRYTLMWWEPGDPDGPRRRVCRSWGAALDLLIQSMEPKP